MKSKVANRDKGKSILVMILDAYQEYCSLGYPRDPSVYVITAHPTTCEKLLSVFKNEAITKSEVSENWGFQVKPNSLIRNNEIIFGPEQISIKWDGK